MNWTKNEPQAKISDCDQFISFYWSKEVNPSVKCGYCLNWVPKCDLNLHQSICKTTLLHACRYCNSLFSKNVNINEMKLHENSCEERKEKCQFCGELVSIHLFKNHKRSCVGNKQLHSQTESCMTNGSQAEMEVPMLLTAKRQTEIIRCRFCKKYISKRELKIHQRWCGKPLLLPPSKPTETCRFCKNAIAKSEMTIHQQSCKEQMCVRIHRMHDQMTSNRSNKSPTENGSAQYTSSSIGEIRDPQTLVVNGNTDTLSSAINPNGDENQDKLVCRKNGMLDKKENTLIGKCRFCLNYLYKVKLEEHEIDCKSARVRCKYSGTYFMARGLTKHQQSCRESSELLDKIGTYKKAAQKRPLPSLGDQKDNSVKITVYPKHGNICATEPRDIALTFKPCSGCNMWFSEDHFQSHLLHGTCGEDKNIQGSTSILTQQSPGEDVTSKSMPLSNRAENMSSNGLLGVCTDGYIPEIKTENVAITASEMKTETESDLSYKCMGGYTSVPKTGTETNNSEVTWYSAEMKDKIKTENESMDGDIAIPEAYTETDNSEVSWYIAEMQLETENKIKTENETTDEHMPGMIKIDIPELCRYEKVLVTNVVRPVTEAHIHWQCRDQYETDNQSELCRDEVSVTNIFKPDTQTGIQVQCRGGNIILTETTTEHA